MSIPVDFRLDHLSFVSGQNSGFGCVDLYKVDNFEYLVVRNGIPIELYESLPEAREHADELFREMMSDRRRIIDEALGASSTSKYRGEEGLF